MIQEAPVLPNDSNAANLGQALEFLARLIRARMQGRELAPDGSLALDYFNDGSRLGDFIRERQPPFEEYVVLLLALAPHVKPALLDDVIRDAAPTDGDYPEIGGRRDPESRALVPTGETAAFLLAGDDLEARFEVQRLFGPEHWFARENVLQLEEPSSGAPVLSGRIQMSRDWVELFTLGQATAPPFGPRFPARRIDTRLEWDDLVLSPSTLEQIEELHRWIRHSRTMADGWGLGGRLRPGYLALFHGPSGTGKTLTASLLGKTTGRPVYRVDLSTVVSKWIGETEKNLANLFDAAGNKNWILFFDEADALFGKRTAVKDAHDRYANQEVSYLLQRVEEFEGLAILATNFRGNMDDAFLRRFNAIIRFEAPDESQRAEIWRRCLPGDRHSDDLPELMARFELTGGNIVNVVQYAVLEAIDAGCHSVQLVDAVRGVRREMEKEGKVFRNLLEAELAERESAAAAADAEAGSASAG